MEEQDLFVCGPLICLVGLQFDDLQAVYLNQRRKSARLQEVEKEAVPSTGGPATAPAGRARDKHGRPTGLDQFSHILSAYTKYRSLFHSQRIVVFGLVFVRALERLLKCV